MKGTIKIKMPGGLHVEILAKVTELHQFEKLVIMDALAHGLNLDEEERRVIGITIASGGVGTVLGVEPETVEIDMSMLTDFLKKKDSESDEG